MILLWFIGILLVGGVACWIMARWSAGLCRWIALAATVADFVLSLVLWIRSYPFNLLQQQEWLRQVNWTWFPEFGIHFHLAIDGLSLLLVVLTFFLGIVSVLASWNDAEEGRHSVRTFFALLLATETIVIGVFGSLDVFFFYVLF